MNEPFLKGRLSSNQDDRIVLNVGGQRFGTRTRSKNHQPFRRSWNGFEEHRDRLRCAALRTLETDADVERVCKVFNIDPLSLALSGLSKKAQPEKNLSVPGAREAFDNAKALMEVVRIQGELVGRYHFDSLFVQREWESIMAPNAIVPCTLT